jgi:hypothetical protein
MLLGQLAGKDRENDEVRRRPLPQADQDAGGQLQLRGVTLNGIKARPRA